MSTGNFNKIAMLEEVEKRLRCHNKCGQFREVEKVVRQLRQTPIKEIWPKLLDVLDALLSMGYPVSHPPHTKYEIDYFNGNPQNCSESSIYVDPEMEMAIPILKLLAKHGFNIYECDSRYHKGLQSFQGLIRKYYKNQEAALFLMQEFNKHGYPKDFDAFKLFEYHGDRGDEDVVKFLVKEGFFVKNEEDTLMTNIKSKLRTKETKVWAREVYDLLKTTIKTPASIVKATSKKDQKK